MRKFGVQIWLSVSVDELLDRTLDAFATPRVSYP